MQKRLDRRLVPLLLFHVAEYWYFYLIALGSLYFLHLVQSYIPEMAKNLGDILLNGNKEDISIAHFVLLAVAVIVLRTLSRNFFFYPARVQQKNLRLEMFEKLEKSHPELYEKFSNGDIFQRLVNDINRLRGLVGFALLQLGNIVIAMFIFIPKISEFNQDFLIAFSPLLFGVIVFSGLVYFFHPHMKKDMEQMAVIQNFIIESYDAKTSIKNYHAEGPFLEAFSKHSENELYHFYMSGFGRIFGPPFIKLGLGCSLLWAAWIVWQQNLSATSLIFFSGFLFLILEPLMFLSWIGIVFSQGIAGWVRIKEFWVSINAEYDLLWTSGQGPFTPRLLFWENEIVLNLKQGKKTVFIGETGCGKSYLLQKLADLFSEKQLKFSYISQDPYLYNDTLMSNIFLGLDVTEEKIERAKYYLDKFALGVLGENLDAVLNLEVGENGKKLSGGQAKRVSLVRSLIADVDIYIWDDPFSSVDFILEKEILQALASDQHLKNKTFIFSSHRLSTVKYCDDVIMLDKGFGVLENGNVENLLAKESKVSEFFQKQMV